MILLCNCPNIVDTQSHLKEWFPVLSPIVVITLFIIDRIIGYYIRKKENDKTWYFKVLLDPSISKISEFYKSTNAKYSIAVDDLILNKSISHDMYLKLKQSHFNNFQELKREFEAEVVSPITYRYPYIAENITSTLHSLEDSFTTSLDIDDLKKGNTQAFMVVSSESRALLLNMLYTPLQNKPIFFIRIYNRLTTPKKE